VPTTKKSKKDWQRAGRADIFGKRRYRRRCTFANIIAVRRRLDVDLVPFAPLPPFKPRSRIRWYLLAGELQRLEAAMYDRLDAEMLELERMALMLDVR
jgi:hypothetical protein